MIKIDCLEIYYKFMNLVGMNLVGIVIYVVYKEMEVLLLFLDRYIF